LQGSSLAEEKISLEDEDNNQVEGDLHYKKKGLLAQVHNNINKETSEVEDPFS